MDVDGVAGPLVVLQANVRGCDRLIVLGTDDDDDQILFLDGVGRDISGLNCRVTYYKPIRGEDHYLAEVPLHEVDLADASELLLENVNLKPKKNK